MPNYAIELECERCPDGVEVVIRDEPPLASGLLAALSGVQLTWRSGEQTEDEMELLRQREQVAQVLDGEQVGWPPMGPRVGPQRWLRPVTPRRARAAYHADKFDHPLVIEFINADNENSLMQFVHKHGIPSARNRDGTDGAAVDDIVRSRRSLELLLSSHHAGDKSTTMLVFEALSTDWEARIFPRLTMPPRAESPQLTLQPSTLLGYMLLEAGMIISGNTRVMRCFHCGKVFISGAHGGKRKTAIYCSNRCRVAEQRATAKSAEAGA